MENNYIEKNFMRYLVISSDINEHLPILWLLAGACNHVTELGVRTMVSSWAFLLGLMNRKGKLVSVDIKFPEEYGSTSIKEVVEECEKLGVEFQFKKESSLDIELEPTDLLFIDTLHFKEQLTKELELHGDKAKKYIILHDTESCKDELVPVIEEFLEKNKQWSRLAVYYNNNGLIILKHE